MASRFALVLGSALLGCASAPPARVPDPAATARTFAAALRADDAEGAYALLDPELREDIGRERFFSLWRENRAELHDLGERIARVDVSAKARAQVALEDGERVALVLEDGTWRVHGGLLDAQALSTPLDAVVELRRALKRQSLPGLLRVLARERRAAWMAAFEKSIAQTGDPLDLRVEIHGDEATVHLSGGGEIKLKREAGRWQIWDVR